MKENYLTWVFRIAIVLLVFLSVFVFMKLSPIWLPFVMILKSILIPFFISGFITYLLHPIVERIHGQGVPRTVAILLIYILFFGSIGFSMYKGIPMIISQLKDLAESSPAFIEQYRLWLKDIESRSSNLPLSIHDRIDEMLGSFEVYLESLIERVIIALKGLVNSIFLILLIPFIVFYLLKDYDKFKKAFWYLTPRKIRQTGIMYLRDIDESLGNYIRGQLLVCFSIGSIATLLLWAFGMKYPLLLGLIIGATNIIPYFGPIIGAIPAAIIAATISLKMVLIIVGIIFVLQFLEGNILSPLIVGKSLSMHPVVIMAALLVGEDIAGVVGLILSIPVLAILKVSVLHLKRHFTKTIDPSKEPMS